MASVFVSFLFIAGIVFAGFLGSLFFRRTRFSDFVLLMLLGVLIGPVFNLLGGESIVFFKSITPFFASLALMILLFEGGLQLRFEVVLREIAQSSVFTIGVFILTLGLSAILLHVLLGWPLLLALMAGAVLGGTSSAIVVPMVNQSTGSERTKTLMTLESAITDALCVIIAIAIGQIALANSVNPQSLLRDLLAAFSIAGVLGLVVGLFWIRILRDVSSTREYQYLLSLGVLFVLFAISDFAGGNGAFSALVFGIVLSNATEISALFKMNAPPVHKNVSEFQREISLFVRTFFFIYLGIVFDLAQLSFSLVLIAMGLTLAVYLARHFGSAILIRLNAEFEKDKDLIRAMMARGLAAAVLATYPLSLGLWPEQSESIVQIAFLVIIFTNLLSTIGLFRYEKNKKELFPKNPVIEEKTPKMESNVFSQGT